MADTFLLEIATPEALVFSDQVEIVTAPGSEGEFGVLAGHTDFLTILKPGVLTYRGGGGETSLFVSSGYSEVSPERTTVLVGSAEELSKIDRNDAAEELGGAKEALAGLTEDDPAYKGALEKLEFAEAKVAALESGGRGGGH